MPKTMWLLGLCTTLTALIAGNVVICNQEDEQVAAGTSTDPQLLQELTANFASILESLTKIQAPGQYQNCLINPSDPEQEMEQIEPEPFVFSKPIFLDARDCNDVVALGHNTSGIYMITPHIYPVSLQDTNVKSFAVYCDMETDGGNWTVLQRRRDALVGFYRDWQEYKQGFGYLDGDHWLGLEKLHQMTLNYRYELRVDLVDFEGNQVYANYDLFQIGDESTMYTLIIGAFEGTAKDSLTYHANMPFSTKDRDNDDHKGSCAKQYKGAWWYNNCHFSNLNGQYRNAPENSDVGMTWYAWKRRHVSLKHSEMKIRRID